MYSAGASQNMWRGTLGNINLSAGTCDITLATTNNFDTVDTANGDFVVIFSHRGDANLQPAQTDRYGWLGDGDGQTQDSAAANHWAIMVK
jgi:hypothetical protein